MAHSTAFRASAAPCQVRGRRSARCAVFAVAPPRARDAPPAVLIEDDNDELFEVASAQQAEFSTSGAVRDSGCQRPAAVLDDTHDAAMRKLEKPPTTLLTGSLKGLVLLNVGALLFGSNQVVIKVVEETLRPEVLNALRFGTAAICFAPFLGRAFRQPSLYRPAFELGTWLTAGYMAQAYGLAQTSAAHGAFTGTFTVLAVPMLVGLSGRRVATRTWLAAGVALAGVSLLTTSGGDPNWGDVWCILSAILFGVHKWRSESVTSQFTSSTTELVAAQLFVLAAASACFATPELVRAVGESGLTGVIHGAAELPWLSILFMGVGTTALTLWIEMDALKEVSSPLAALIYTAEPLWGAAFAWVLLDERWGAGGWVGAVLILAASLFSQLGGDPAEKLPSDSKGGGGAGSSKV